MVDAVERGVVREVGAPTQLIESRPLEILRILRVQYRLRTRNPLLRVKVLESVAREVVGVSAKVFLATTNVVRSNKTLTIDTVAKENFG